VTDLGCLRPHLYRFEQEVSPTSGVPRAATSTSTISNVSPTDTRVSSFGNYRRDLAVLETSGGRSIPQIQHNPPTAASPNPIAPWMSSNNGSPVVPSSAFGTSFYNNDSSDNLSQGSQLSPGFRPGTGRTGNTSTESPDVGFFGDDRRPSVASVTTASSSGSRSSAARTGIHKSLKGFFGDDFPGRDGSETSLPAAPNGKELKDHKEHRSNSYTRHRNHSTTAEPPPRESSPVPSRPRTPVPSSDVVPFLYQDSQVSEPSAILHPSKIAHHQASIKHLGPPIPLSWPLVHPLSKCSVVLCFCRWLRSILIVMNRTFRFTEKLQFEGSYPVPIKSATGPTIHHRYLPRQPHQIGQIVRIGYICLVTATDSTKVVMTPKY
jgi:hypothetical protein